MNKKGIFIALIAPLLSLLSDGKAGAGEDVWTDSFDSFGGIIQVRSLKGEEKGTLKEGAPLTLRLTDVAKAAGHLCPGTAGGFQITRLALNALYGDRAPVREDITVVAGERYCSLEAISFITGAREHGHHGKRLFIDNGIKSEDGQRFIFYDRKGKRAVSVTYDMSGLNMKEMKGSKANKGKGVLSQSEEDESKRLIREKIRKIFTLEGKKLFRVEEVKGYSPPEG